MGAASERGELAGHHYRWEPATGEARGVVAVFHGTGGDEDDLLPLAQAMAPRGWAFLSVRGNVSESGMNRYFRRVSEGIFDFDDVRRRTDELAVFLAQAMAQHASALPPPVAFGYSNGANIAAALLLRRGRVLSGGILLRPMMPLPDDDPDADLAGVPILMLCGDRDPICPPESAKALASRFIQSGGDVALTWIRGGHGLSQEDLDAAGEWMIRRK